MSAKIARLRGLERIRKIQEEMQRWELERVVTAVAEVETALRHRIEAAADALARSRAALGTGDRDEWLFADAQSQVTGSSIVGLRGLRRQRETSVAPAMNDYLECRKLHEQARVLLANAESDARAAEIRKTQAEIDAWVVSRWARGADKS